MRIGVNCTPRLPSGTLSRLSGERRLSLHVILFAAVAVLAVYALLLGVLWMNQERVVFQPPAVLAGARLPDVDGLVLRQVSYRAEDGTALGGFIVGEPERARGLVVAFHGNADLARNLVPWAAQVVRRTHTAVFLPEIRGYDGFAGRPTYGGAALDARAALRVVRDSLHIPPTRLAYFGHSLGSAIATELASEQPPAVLILESPLSSARAMAQRMLFPGLSLLWRIVSRVHYDTVRRVGELKVPVWVAHGDRDVIIPVRMGREVFAAAAVPGELLIVRGAGHNDVALQAGDAYWTWMQHALSVTR